MSLKERKKRMYKFDSQLPKTRAYWKENDIFHIKHTSFSISIEEAYAIAELLKVALRDHETKAVVIDNREAKGVWTQEINKIWEKVPAEVNGEKPKKFITLTNSITAALQINRIARNSGVESLSKAFYGDLNDEVKAFIDAE